jgi:hypothetical protein
VIYTCIYDCIQSCAPRALQVANGVEPGMHITVKSSTELVYATVAFHFLQSLLDAYAIWQASLSTATGRVQQRGLSQLTAVPVPGPA